jgi:hypothetical protein
MKLRFEVDQADSFRRGIDRPKSIISIEVNPADIPEHVRSVIANHLVGIDVLQLFYHNGEVIKGYPIRELSYTSHEPKRIVANAGNLEALVEAVKENDHTIERIEQSFSRPVQFRMIDKPPKNEVDFLFISSQRPAQLQEVSEAIRQKRRICFECFLQDIQTSLNQLLHANSYLVYLLPIPPSTAQGRFYCEPVFAAGFLGRQVVAHSPTIVLNEKTGRILEATNLFQAVDLYLFHSGNRLDDLSILSWENNDWRIFPPEAIIDISNDALAKLTESRQTGCLGCARQTPTQGPRICPLCGLMFSGNGWDGIDGHWRARHEHVMPYETFWHSLCPAHRGS